MNDSRRSDGRWTTKEVGKKLRLFLEVPGEGVITMMLGSDPVTGQLQPETIGLIMRAELESGRLPSDL